ncbi:glycoside hydrolase family 28 protein [uncultured Alistipes sp.]|uniref:glycoside hydrolase family 28 protein n=2 Tax=uncultured Alistipes sp. TaxID=538949 RepID=UPI0025FCB606|nr:glycosyl hydrolase family 28 protein [uncultured Alistipes sp.]
MNRILRLLALCAMSFFTVDCNRNVSADNPFPELEWIAEVGARSFPRSEKVFCANAYGAVGDAMTDATQAVQAAIEACKANGGGKVTFEPGIYLIGSLFIDGDNIEFEIPRGTTLIGSQDIADYRRIETRVAGVEMEWPAALINVMNCSNSAITGQGTINARGKVFWDKYWAMRREYNPKGLRWIVDYDCERPRGILISECSDITVRDIVLYQPGFWSLHILYSEYVTVDNVIISNNIEGRGPSTDGVDIDSSHHILVENSQINCNDDNFCLKAGRDSDGLRVGRPCEYVVIRNCVAGHGDGLFTCGSETSGSIRHIAAYNMTGIGTKYGLRFKSTCQRGGTIEDIWLGNVEMRGVRDPFVVDLNWNPAYSTSRLPAEFEGKELPEHWLKMLAPVDPERGTPKFRDVHFRNVRATDAATCIKVGGIESSTIDGFTFENVSFQGRNGGSIAWACDWTLRGFDVAASEKPLSVEHCQGVDVE